ncbi:MAG TPA: hypothetical protein DCX52_14060 [Massilia sp.]|nr:hypothetical protein [Massilia sp.]
MRIPTGNFGHIVAEPQQQAQVRGSGAIGQALSNVSNAIAGVAQDMQQAVVQRQRSQSAATLATLSNSGYDLSDQIGRDVSDGKLAADQAVPEFRKRMGELVGASTKDFTNDQRLIIDEHLVKLNGMHERNLNGIAIKRTQYETGANLLNMSEQFQRAAMRDLPGAINQWNGAVDTMGPAAGWDPEKIATAKQAFKENASYNFADATLEGAAQTGNADLVRAAREKLEGPEGEAIDPARRTALITKAYGFENGIKAAGVREAERLKREQEARENKARDAFKDAQGLVLNGRYLSTEYISELSAITAGTSAAPAVQELVRAQAAVAGFASLPLSQQTATIERRRAAGSTPGMGVSVDEEQMTAAMERIRDGSVRAYAENPWTAAQERGVIPRAPALQLNDIAGAQAVLAERMKQIGTVEAAAERKISPLQPQEAEQIGRMVQSLPPDQQSAALASFGKMIGDADRLAALAHQIDAKDKVLGTAMMIGDLQTTQGRYLSELVIKGARAIKDKAIMMDERKETGWRGAIANEIGDAFPNQEVREKMVEAAYYVQAGFAAEGGGADISRAVRMVAGRIVEHNGSKIPLPRGMEEGTFEKRLASIKPADLAAQAPGGSVFIGKTAVPIEQFVNSLPDAALVHAGQGRYNIRAGMGLVTNAQGKRITIEVRNGN